MPKITEITVGAATSFNHPFESYSNFKPSVVLKATVGESEDVSSAVVALQMLADDMVCEEKARILAALELAHETAKAKDDVAHWGARLREAQEEIEHAKHTLESPDALRGLAQWQVEDTRRTIEEGPARIAKAERELASARERLAALTGDHQSTAE